jgi:hypothetical protein
LSDIFVLRFKETIDEISSTGRMKKQVKILMIFMLVMLSGFKGYSQINTQKADSLRLKDKQEQTSTLGNTNNGQGNAYGQVNKNAGSQSVKRVKAGQPDMSKAKGARPPMIVRPSGSGIPKGVGKPGGVGRKGGR